MQTYDDSFGRGYACHWPIQEKGAFQSPTGSMYGIFTYIYYIYPFTIKKQPNVGKYTIHGYYGSCFPCTCGKFRIHPITLFLPIFPHNSPEMETSF